MRSDPIDAEERLPDCGARPNCVCSQAAHPRRRVAPLRYRGSEAQAMALLVAVVRAMPRSRVVTQDERSLRAEFRTRLRGFVDDVTLIVRPEGIIDVRSASRVGYWDLGVNRRRVERLRRAFEGGDARPT